MKTANFGHKTAWLAIRAKREDVANLLLADATSSDWRKGLDAAYEFPNFKYGQHVFVTPALDGWVLCVGSALLPFFDARPPTIGKLTRQLATLLNAEVQYFATHRVVEAHGWSKATREETLREFAFVGESGETLADHGARTSAEADVGEFVCEDDVMRVARGWSVDPSELESRFPTADEGLLGRLVIPKLPSPAKAVTATPNAAPPPVSKAWWKLW